MPRSTSKTKLMKAIEIWVTAGPRDVREFLGHSAEDAAGQYRELADILDPPLKQVQGGDVVNYQNKQFHLSVDREGLVSLWDKEDLARRVRGESYVCLQLTDEQVRALDQAKVQAQQKQG